MPASACFAHYSRSTLSSPPSTSFSRSWLTSASKICVARPARSCCSSLNAKSIRAPVPLTGGERHPETKHRDQVAWDLVRATPERQDDEAAVRVLEASLEHRAGRVFSQIRTLTEDLHQQPEGLDVKLGAEHLGRRRVGGLQVALRRRPGNLPVD